MACAVQIPKYGRLRTEPKVYCEIETSARLDLTVNFHHGHFIDPTNCPWVSEDEKYMKFIQFCFKFKQEKTRTIVNCFIPLSHQAIILLKFCFSYRK